MDVREIRDEVVEVLTGFIGSQKTISDSDSLKGLGLDSLDVTEAAIQFEEDLGIVLEDDEIDQLNYVLVGDLISTLCTKVSAKESNERLKLQSQTSDQV